MVKGKVIQRFMDKNTRNIYAVGDEYKAGSKKRLDELIELEFVEPITEKEKSPAGESNPSPKG
ncbi:hypothetical protein [Sporolactobacillus nakayamae]|uniref:Uncharacterized protein n=1 Tax=Sporolactobacillus nakayamae TaxID=269670 RepID=A0A1I2PAR3_9BACL|nr:hypothetical protein [Sporolactobacillus nakayamae]SFG10541.1 hypothetical protein SAMN02982927_00691 [Sporolactobacillus nakayamae]